jgi:hypothetical protein
MNNTKAFTLRMLGDNITLGYWQWIELLDELKPDSQLARRIRNLLLDS